MTNVNKTSESEKHATRCPALPTSVGVCVCDGYHTFDELYEHRISLFLKLCDKIYGEMDVWRSKLHNDGSNFDGWFLLGIDKRKGKQITYHLPIEKWVYANFAQTLDRAPEFDGHTSDDVLQRLHNI